MRPILMPELVTLNVKVADWQEAVNLSVGLLEKNGYVEQPSSEKFTSNQKLNFSFRNLGWKLSLATVALVIAVQGPIFSLTHHFSHTFGPCAIAFFYIGAFISALLCDNFKL